jgi:hypothetical protein
MNANYGKMVANATMEWPQIVITRIILFHDVRFIVMNAAWIRVNPGTTRGVRRPATCFPRKVIQTIFESLGA